MTIIKQMKKLAAIGSILIPFVTATQAFAQINITPPAQGYKDLGTFITNIIQLAFVIALIVVLVMLVWGAFQWIVSGGDKEAVGSARGRIINALVGLAILAVAFALFRFAGQFLGFGNLGPGQFSLPVPTPPTQ